MGSRHQHWTTWRPTWCQNRHSNTTELSACQTHNVIETRLHSVTQYVAAVRRLRVPVYVHYALLCFYFTVFSLVELRTLTTHWWYYGSEWCSQSSLDLAVATTVSTCNPYHTYTVTHKVMRVIVRRAAACAISRRWSRPAATGQAAPQDIWYLTASGSERTLVTEPDRQTTIRRALLLLAGGHTRTYQHHYKPSLAMPPILHAQCYQRL